MIDPDGFLGSAESLQDEACGSGWTVEIVPENYFGIRLTKACVRHDYRYRVGKTHNDKLIADLILMSDILELLLEDFDSEGQYLNINMLVYELENVCTNHEEGHLWDEFWDKTKKIVDKSETHYFEKWIRYEWSKAYFDAVYICGDKAFWDGKTEPVNSENALEIPILTK
jgi:hypothetical protein